MGSVLVPLTAVPSRGHQRACSFKPYLGRPLLALQSRCEYLKNCLQWQFFDVVGRLPLGRRHVDKTNTIRCSPTSTKGSFPAKHFLSNSTILSKMEATLDPIFQGRVDSKRIPGAAAVALGASGEVLFSKGYGNVVAGDTSSPKVTPDTPALIWSCTKLVTCVAGMQLIEQGKLNLDDPVEKYVPAIADVPKLEGWNDDGSPKLGKQTNKIKVINLFTHTSGFSYDFFNQDALKWRISQNQPPVAYVTRSSKEEYNLPLVFEPGERWEYGCNQEWIGYIIEAISGLGLAEYIDKNIVQPLGLKNTGVKLSEDQDKEFFTVHTKNAAGELTPTPMRMVENPEVVPGGHFLYSSCADYTQILLTLLNNGTHPKSGVKILESDTVEKYVFKDLLPSIGTSGNGVGDVPSTVNPVTSTGTLLPGISKGWSLVGLINNEDAPNGRNKSSAMWAGLGNCYFWMDQTAGKLGFVVSAILPFYDRDVLYLADALERAVYDKPQAKEIGEKGSNFEGGVVKDAEQ